MSGEWPKTTQITAILSSDGTYNVYMYASEAVAVISLSSSQNIQRENIKHSRRHYKESKPTSNNRQEASPSVPP